ncbi:MAG: hypothetical protein R2856_31910 [Caldilineaceae bacterium]
MPFEIPQRDLNTERRGSARRAKPPSNTRAAQVLEKGRRWRTDRALRAWAPGETNDGNRLLAAVYTLSPMPVIPASVSNLDPEVHTVAAVAAVLTEVIFEGYSSFWNPLLL